MLSRNAYASGDLALPLSIWHFAYKSHGDACRRQTSFIRFGRDSTARNVLNSMTEASMRDIWSVTGLHSIRSDCRELFLNHLLSQISACFRTEPIAKYRINPERKTRVQATT
ncbi:hypothetical protein B0H17DRAFT_1039967 [Mycena rosella]|uniref:Uncharacterized protein n=1 Tax=Mycena rosella TaxID=1033263 RepID=A0AAD7GT17_MYCRO|nr:hypothetical protein B0H17DRAFT_1039967 [Mycena rosella]